MGVLCVFAYEWMGSEETEREVHGERAVLRVEFCPSKRSVEVLTHPPHPVTQNVVLFENRVFVDIIC